MQNLNLSLFVLTLSLLSSSSDAKCGCVQTYQPVCGSGDLFISFDTPQFYQHVYAQLLLAKIPKVQKDIQVIGVFLRFCDSIIKRW